jgi:hypothetical protein
MFVQLKLKWGEEVSNFFSYISFLNFDFDVFQVRWSLFLFPWAQTNGILSPSFAYV